MMTKSYLICKISDLKFEIRMEEIKYTQAIEDEEESIAVYHLKKISVLKKLVNNSVKKLNTVD